MANDDLKKKILRNITRKRLDTIVKLDKPWLMNRDALIAHVIANWADHREAVSKALESQAREVLTLE